MAAWDVDRCPVHRVRLKRGMCPECRREAINAVRAIRARSRERDAHGNFVPVVHVPSVDDGENAA